MTFFNFQGLIRHNGRKHPKMALRYPCDLDFDKDYSLKVHKKDVHNKKDDLFKCEFCPFESLHFGGFSMHKKSHFRLNKNFTLKSHKQQIHKEISL